MIRLRPHHLLCTLTFEGKGYTPLFVENMTQIIARIAADEGIELVEGPDDICAPLYGTDQWHCTNESVQNRDQAVLDIFDGQVQVGDSLTKSFWQGLKKDFAAGRFKSSCANCQWSNICYQDEF